MNIPIKINLLSALIILCQSIFTCSLAAQGGLSLSLEKLGCGQIISNTTGGYSTYEYEWSGPGITTNNFHLPNVETGFAGTYCVTVSDLICQSIEVCIELTCDDIFLDETCGIIVQDFGSNQFCGDNPGSGFIDIEMIPLDGQYNYRWSKDGQLFSSDQDLSGISEGQYTVTVTTPAGCTVIETFDICCCFPELINILDWPFDVTQVPQIDNSLLCALNIEFGNLLEGIVTHASGADSQDGIIDLLIEPSNTISFSWTLNGASFPGNGPDLTNLNPGLYCVDMDYGCNGIISACFLVLDQSCTDFDFIEGSNIVPQCGSESNGGIDITLNSEFEPYTFSWDTASQNEDLTNLAAGDYCVTITGSNGCTGSECFTVGTVIEPGIQNQNVVHPTNASLGSIELELTGSVGQVLWSNGSAGTSSITGLEPGNHCVTITSDGNTNCEVVECFDLEQLCNIDDIPVTITESICGNGGSITLDINPSAIISWRDENGMFVGDGPSITDLGPGQYCASISAVNNGGCIFCYDVVDSGGEISNVQWNLACGTEYELSFDGGELPLTLTGTIYINGFTIPFDQSPLLITSNPFTIDLGGNNIEGILNYVLESSGNCSDTYNGSINLTGHTAFSVSIPPENIEPCELGVIDSEGSLTVNILAGEAPYEIAWSTGVVNQETIIVDESGTYCVTVTDACGDVESTCVEQNCESLTDTYNNEYCARQFGVQIHRDCPCINDCGGLIGDLDNSDLEIEVFNWDLILGTLEISVFNPDGGLVGQVILNNGNGQQEFIGSSEIGITDEDCDFAGEYTVSVYASWLNIEITCTFTFSCTETVCSFINGTWGQNGGNTGYNYNYSFGCYSCETCAYLEGFNNDLSLLCDTDVANAFIFVPFNENNPCAGGLLTINCPCPDFEFLEIEIPETVLGQYIDANDGSIQDFILDPLLGIDVNIPCDPQGFCIFDGNLLTSLGLGLESNSDFYTNDLVTAICYDVQDPPPPPPGKCPEGSRIIYLDENTEGDGDPCTVQYFCDNDPNIIYTEEVQEQTCVIALPSDDPEFPNGCLLIDYCGCTPTSALPLPAGSPDCAVQEICPSCITGAARPSVNDTEFSNLPSDSEIYFDRKRYTVSPIPTESVIKIIDKKKVAEQIEVNLYTINSTTPIHSSIELLQNDYFQLSVDVPSGVYILKIQNSNVNEIHKIMVVRNH